MRVLGLGLALAIAMGSSGRASAPEPDAPPIDTKARLLALLPPALREVALPWPDLRGEGSVSATEKLRWLATLAHRANDLHRYSDGDAWRALMAWPEAKPELALALDHDESAPDLGLGRYPVPRGREDPAVDFAASVALAWLDAKHFSCSFPLRARFLRDSGLLPPGPVPLEAGRCKVFERAFRPAEVEAIDLVFVAQRWQDAAATMGHTLFRVRHRAVEGVVGPSTEPVFSYVAIDPPETPNYLLKGMTGGLTATVRIDRMGDIWARYGVREGRDLFVYELVLSPDERRYLLAEVFAQSQGGMNIPYAFFATNCATMAWDTVRAVLPELPRHGGFLVHPHEVASLLVGRGRARALGVIPAQKTLARRAEDLRESLALSEDDLPEAYRAHARRWGKVDARAEALRELEQAVREHRPDPPALARLAAWTDAVLDIETFALDVAHQGYVVGATSPALEAALDLRARLPASEPDPTVSDAPTAPASTVSDTLVLPGTPAAPVGPSGSRKSTLVAGFSDGQVTLGWSTSVLDELVGEPRAVVLSTSSRMRLLVNELVLAIDADALRIDANATRHAEAVQVDAERLTIIDSATWGDGVRTDRGWLEAHLGFGFALETVVRPRLGLPFAARLAGGPGLTLAASEGFAAHLVVQAEVTLATWTRVGNGDPAFRSTVGLVLEAAAPLGSAHRVRLRGRIAPGLDLGGLALETEATLGFDFALDRQRGVFFVARGGWRAGLPVGNGPEVSAGVAF
ncbi:MAG: DUF4105 domain-containing protein [Deltaproteobacteria bacterium]|nr:DUF4105 domain-containing protein [Deltaproteobacteria bacterium]